MNALVAADVCRYCQRSLHGQDEDLIRRKNRYGDEIKFHAGCFELAKAEAAQARRDRITRYGSQFMMALPAWPWARVGSPEFAQRVHQKFRKLAENYQLSHGSVLAQGPSGDGKTSAIVALIHRLHSDAIEHAIANPPAPDAPPQPAPSPELARIANIRWTTATDLVRAVQQHPLGAGGEPRPITKAKQASVLIIDELGPEPQHGGEVIFEIIDQRYSVAIPTIVTTGRTGAELSARYGDALVRRLSEQGIGMLVSTFEESK